MRFAGDNVELTGYYAGVLGKIIELHATYCNNWGFDMTFEAQVAREISDFMREFDPDRDGLWAALQNGRFAGSISIDGHVSPSEGARLR